MKVQEKVLSRPSSARGPGTLEGPSITLKEVQWLECPERLNSHGRFFTGLL